MPEMPGIGAAASGYNDIFHLNGIQESMTKKLNDLNNLPQDQQTVDLLMKIQTLSNEISRFSEDVTKFHEDLHSSNYKITQSDKFDNPDDIGGVEADINVISQSFLERQHHLEEWGASLEHRIYELNL